MQATFSLASDVDRPKLLKGVYLLGLRQGIWNERADLPDDPSQLPPEMLATFFFTMACTLVLAGVMIGIRYRIETLTDGAVQAVAEPAVVVASRDAEPVN